jgi:hypothetical protein
VTTTRGRAAFLPLWADSLGWFVACVATVALAAASMPVAGWASDGSDPVSATPSTPLAGIQRAAVILPQDRLDARPVGRCDTCGVVEMVRTLHLAGATPATYELTVRFRDGSRRVSSHADHAGWRAGDSILLMGGAKLAHRT